MTTRKARPTAARIIRDDRRKLNQLDPSEPNYRQERAALLRDIRLAKYNAPRKNRRPPTARPKQSNGKKGLPAPSGSQKSAKKSKSLSEFLTPKNIQQSIKTVGNLRGVVKNCLNYLQQADRMLETFYVTSNTLKESGVLEKIVKNRGKNLTTDDFTNVLIALMSSPMGGQLFKAMGSQSGDDTPANASATQQNGNTQA